MLSKDALNHYSAAFFVLYENVYRLAAERCGVKEALDFMRSLFERGLSKAYTASTFVKGNHLHPKGELFAGRGLGLQDDLLRVARR